MLRLIFILAKVALGYLTLEYKVSFSCGGSLISDTFVLTAARCVIDNQQPVVARLGKVSEWNSRPNSHLKETSLHHFKLMILLFKFIIGNSKRRRRLSSRGSKHSSIPKKNYPSCEICSAIANYCHILNFSRRTFFGIQNIRSAREEMTLL